MLRMRGKPRQFCLLASGRPGSHRPQMAALPGLPVSCWFSACPRAKCGVRSHPVDAGSLRGLMTETASSRPLAPATSALGSDVLSDCL